MSEPVFNTRGEIAYLQVVMQCSVYYLNTNEIPNNNISLWSPWQENWVTFASNFYFPQKVALKQSLKILRENKNLTRLYTTFFGC